MIENEANASEDPESPTAPARTDVPLVAALHRPAVTVRHRQRLIEHRFTRPDRLAAQRARRSQNAPTVLDQLRTALAEPISRIVENITAPLQQMMRRIAEMIRPSWLRAIQKMKEHFQNLVRNPMLDALRRIRERMATFISLLTVGRPLWPQGPHQVLRENPSATRQRHRRALSRAAWRVR